MEDRIREVATQPGAGGYRKVAAALLADHGIKVDVLLVSPLAAQRGSSPIYTSLANPSIIIDGVSLGSPAADVFISATTLDNLGMGTTI